VPRLGMGCAPAQLSPAGRPGNEEQEHDVSEAQELCSLARGAGVGRPVVGENHREQIYPRRSWQSIMVLQPALHFVSQAIPLLAAART
jgi:hypothetical protein